jgi:hypothetical protein
MCLECGYYKGRQVMDLEAEKAKRDARIKAKKERIKVEGTVPAPETEEVKETVATNEVDEKEASENAPKEKRPEKKPE